MTINVNRILEARIQRQNRFLGTLQGKLTADYLLGQSPDKQVVLIGLLDQASTTLLDLIDCYRSPSLVILGDESLEVEADEISESEADTDVGADAEEELTA